MKEVKKKNELSEKEEIDAYFSDATKKSFPIKLLFVFLLLLCVAGVLYYYFVIDSPRNIFLTIINDNVNKIGSITTNDNLNYDFFLETNIETNNRKYLNVVDIINRVSLKGKIAIDYEQNKTLLEIKPYYQKEEILTAHATTDGTNTYIKLNNIYDKVIKYNVKDDVQEKQENKSTKINIKESEQIVNSLKKIIVEVLKEANYTKEYVTLDNNKVKKVTLNIDKDIAELFYNKLLNDNNFIEAYSKFNGITETKLEEELNNKKSKLDSSVEKISLYVTILKNEFVMLEGTIKEKRLIVNKKDDEYNYKLYSNSIIQHQGNISIEGSNNDYEIEINHDDINKELNIEVDLLLNIIKEKNNEWLDISSYVNYEDLTETETDKITKKLLENKTTQSLYKDIISIMISDMIGTLPIQATR